MSDWTHPALQRDLADTRRACGEIVGEQLGLGSWGGAAWVDVGAMRPSWAHPRPTVWEVKISRADFLADVRADKWRKYLPVCERLYFAVPAGLVDKREVPAEAGLAVRGPNGWNVQRAPRKQPATKAHTLMMALLFKNHPASWRGLNRAQRMARAASSLEQWGYVGHSDGIVLSERVARAFRLAQDAGEHSRAAIGILARALGVEPEHCDLLSIAYSAAHAIEQARRVGAA